MHAPTPAPGIRKGVERNDLAKSEEAAAAANKEKNVEEARMSLCKLTDLELSGAATECCRAQRAGNVPPRPLERLVMPTGHNCSGAR